MASSADLAEAFHITPRHVQRLARDGTLANHGKGDRYEFYWPEAVWQYLSLKLAEQIERTEDEKKTEARKAKADADYKAAKAAQEELELAELEGNMHRSEDVEAAFEQLTYNMRSEILALPGRLAIDVVAAETPAEAANVIQEQINAVLQSLSEFEYDPAFYAERVRERKGWTEVDGENGGAEG